MTGTRNWGWPFQLSLTAWLAGILVLVAAARLVNAQSEPGPAAEGAGEATQQDPAPGEKTPTLTSNVNEVSLDLVIHNKSHEPVLNLKPDDLVVLDDGKQVKLTGLHLISADTPNAPGHMVTLVFDSFRGPIAKSAHSMADRVLAALPAQGFSFAVMDFTNRLRLVQGFTSDRAAVEKAVQVETDSNAIEMATTLSQAIDVAIDKEADAARNTAVAKAEKDLIAIAQTGADTSGRHADFSERARAQALLRALQDTPEIAQKQKAWLNLAGLMALARAQQRMTDRRAIIYFTINRMMDPASERMLKTIADVATEAGVSLYTVDLDATPHNRPSDGPNARFNGVGQVGTPAQEDSAPIHGVAPPPPAAPIGPRAPSPQPSSGAAPVWTWRQDVAVMTDFMRSSGEDRTDPFADNRNQLAGLSRATGGIYIDALNNTRKPIERMAQDLTTYYQATYVPPFKDYDGKFRKVEVNSIRAGVTVKTRAGYLALPPNMETAVHSFELPLLKVLAAPELPAALKFRADVLRFGDLPDGNASALAIELPLSELQVKADPQTNVPEARVAVVAQVKDASGVVVEHFSEDLVRRGVAQTLAHDPLAAVSFTHSFLSSPGKYTLETALIDQNSQQTGASRTSFEIAAASEPVGLSDMVLVRSLEPHYAEQEDPLQPLRYEHQNIVPNLAGDMGANLKNASVFFMLHPDPQSSAPLTLEMELDHNGQKGDRSFLYQANEARSAIPYMARISAGELAPGDYSVTAFVTQGTEKSTQTKTFHVEGVSAAPASSAPVMAVGDEEIPFGNAQPRTTAPAASAKLAIKPLTEPAPPPSPGEARQLLESARANALDFSRLLPKFACTETTRRSVDRNGNGHWQTADVLVEELDYRNHQEQRRLTERNGVAATDSERTALKGTVSSGEFGGVLRAVFNPDSQAAFSWKRTDALLAGTVQVFDYTVGQAHSAFQVKDATGKRSTVGFHGEVFLDSATRRVRRVTLIADGLPAGFRERSTSITVDYDFVPIDGLRYLMPVSAELQLHKGQHQALVNTMSFSDYRRANN